MVDSIEVFGKVNIHCPVVASFDVFLASHNRLFCTPPRTESITIIREFLFVDWSKNLSYGLLYHPISNCRDTKQSLPHQVLVFLPA